MIGDAAYPDRVDRLYNRLGVRFDRRDLAGLLALAMDDALRPTMYVTCNLNHLRVLQSQSGFRDAYRKATFITLDSRPIQLVSHFLFGERVPLVTGADLFAQLFRRLRPGTDRPYFLASSDATEASLNRNLIDRGFLPEAISCYSPPFGFETDTECSQRMIAQIRAHGTTHLFLGVGAPKSELWVARNFDALPAAHIFCVGAALDFTAGEKTRAPSWFGNLGLEWLHRLASEPRRLLPRYMGDATILAMVLVGHILARVSAPYIDIIP
jgi:N-acetylglucosaminyldiphosphoundecaprenol N-acetyl-beta-D-mannosaminyltransferase